LDEFAKALVESARDEAIRECDMCARPGAPNPVARRWSALGIDARAFEVLIPDIVDQALSALLRAVDQEVLKLKVQAETEVSWISSR
jgi:hypothetical protein